MGKQPVSIVPGQCQGQNKDGEPCSAYVRPGEQWCQWHDPARAAEREGWRLKGGTQRSHRRRAEKDLRAEELSLAAITGLLCQAMRQVMDGELEAPRAQAMGSLARAIAALKQAGEFEERLAALEERAQQEGQRRA